MPDQLLKVNLNVKKIYNLIKFLKLARNANFKTLCHFLGQTRKSEL